MNKTFCYWTVAFGEKHAKMAYVLVDSARKAGVTADFHVYTDYLKEIPTATVHDSGKIEIGKYMFKFHFLKEQVSKLNYDYYVFLDTDNYFTKNPGDLVEFMGDDKIFVQMENDCSPYRSKRQDWWSCPIADYGKFLREQGAISDTYYNTNAGFFIVAKTAINEFYERTTKFFDAGHKRGYSGFTEEPALAFVGHVMQNPKKRLFEDTCWLWASDWTGQWKDTLPEYKEWQFEDYMSGDKYPVKPCIVHAMRSKDAMIKRYETLGKPIEETIASFEVLMCCYGDFYDISSKTINAILATSSKKVKIRVALSDCGIKTKEYFRKLFDEKKIESIFEFNTNINKDPSMRKLIDSCESEYFLWLDDDTYPVKEGWVDAIEESFKTDKYDVGGFTHVSGRGGYGGYRKFLEQRPWFKSWDEYNTYPDPTLKNDNIPFPIGCLWTGKTQYFIDNGFPDRGMIKKCDDMLLGELIHQTHANFKHLGNIWNYFDTNKAPRRGTGEEAHDGWIMNKEPPFNGLTIYPTGGMCNRIRNFVTAYTLCKEKHVKLKWLHETSDTLIAGVKFNNYWTIPSDVIYENLTTAEIMVVHNKGLSDGTIHRKIPINKLSSALHNHWGLAVLDDETVEFEGLARLIIGLKENVLPLTEEWQDKVNVFVQTHAIGNMTGLHIRSFEFMFGSRSDEQDKQLVKNFADKIAGGTDKIFVATDSKQVQEALKSALGDRMVTYSDIASDYVSRNTVLDFEKGLMDFYILSRCAKVLGTKGSSYSHLAGLLSGNLEWCMDNKNTKEWDG